MRRVSIKQFTILAIHGLCLLAATSVSAQPPEFDGKIVKQFDADNAYQAVAVGQDAFYAISNVRLARHDKDTGRVLQQWDGSSQLSSPLSHLDSGVVLDGKLYSAHSNYPGWPMTSTVEVWDIANMQHIETHSFGVMLGSFTWLDRHNDSWWGAFANYDIVQRGMTEPYGGTRNTVVVQFDDDFEVLQSWSLPAGILRRMSPMSNSGGSWGSDGYLYLSGHDDPEIYVMALPEAGSELDWLATVRLPGLNGQGIAWDRSNDENTLWAILRSTRQVLKIEMPVLPNLK
ncbi:MAG: hypothetical protein O3C29_11710 [Proteobacteria bacterium]|nr:hypothetical protein [Pseudomonadota bacterium]MDA1289852.1 hypothetical protein [Pseudomonadota bacterium]